MKKVLGLLLVGILASVGIFYFITSRKYQSFDSRYVNLQPGQEQLIVLVNMGNGDRKFIAERIREVFDCQPSLIAIDLFFKDFSPEIEKDSLLLSSIKNSKPILATLHKGIATHGVHRNYLNASLDYGYAEISIENGYVTNYDVYREIDANQDFHFAYVIAEKVDSLAAKRFTDNLEGNVSDIVISKLSSQFKIFDFDEEINCELLKDKIVLLGYLGPTNEDKFTTYARYRDQSDAVGPDMYGPVIIANQILMILNN